MVDEENILLFIVIGVIVVIICLGLIMLIVDIVTEFKEIESKERIMFKAIEKWDGSFSGLSCNEKIIEEYLEELG